MSSLPRRQTRLLPRPTIFTRTYLLVFAALLVAEGSGLVLLINGPPLHNAPMSLPQAAMLLRSGPMEPFGPGPPPPGSPPLPPDGAPGGPGPARSEWALRESAAPPFAPANVDQRASTVLRDRLAAMLGEREESVRVFVGTEGDGPPVAMGPDSDPQLPEGFIAALQRGDGRWTILESAVQRFPDEFQRQALWLFAIGLAILLPIAWLFAHALSAPIRRFAEAAKRLGSDPYAPPLEREGPAEMLAAVDAFNAMQAQLSRLLRERTHMIGAIAHDLRTPLTRLAFRLEGMPSPLKDKAEADIREMKEMISAALGFIRDRSRPGMRRRLDFRLLVESVVDDHADLGHDVTLEPGEPITLAGEPGALKRLVSNLVDNALKYGTRALLRLRVQSDTCTLEVEDDGPGIPEHLQQQVFEPFFRAESSRNRDTGGIGLGLAAVRSIALEHGGEVSLRNRRDGGLRVFVSLPAQPIGGS